MKLSEQTVSDRLVISIRNPNFWERINQPNACQVANQRHHGPISQQSLAMVHGCHAPELVQHLGRCQQTRGLVLAVKVAFIRHLQRCLE
ncbi:hypothetical protein HZ326_7800 [Fusarium oxysporum f. sp. albedinis]|nr:hypothetical protein HZ326_7800 [Fusarium oxysporum f. sp. albedinis]